ncbi:putative mitochondrial carrier-like protein [Emericellopsis cladophorae]|uniref:Mitochondrial carrier-like protein n=1 Tax=Emericellopsis cladophorae TaxID=2686198 RepID=A0A9P9Y140_9HYPO|nr:putative mitochondrial carrier-like protein [Emericellopsis cladophorae]KAI6781648.1 putative mitochondrial carrier-like protein [Emericellopsis cladophorae]
MAPSLPQDPADPSKKKAPSALRSVIAGSTAVAKTRSQLNRRLEAGKKLPWPPFGSQWYAGCTTLIIGNSAKAGIRFVAFDQYKSMLADENGKLTGPRTVLAGFGAGVTESLLAVTPTESIKTTLIDDRKRAQPRMRGFLHAVPIIAKERGLAGFFQGFVPTTLRQSANSAVRFGSYTSLRQLAESWTAPGEKLGTISTFTIGGLAGLITVAVTQPLDTIKTRMQSPEAKAVYGNTLRCGTMIFKNEGITTFWSGALPRLARLVLSGGIVFTMYEKSMELMNRMDPEMRAAPADTWFPVGRLSSFPEVGEDDEDLVHPRECSATARPGCKVFNVPKDDLSKRSEVLITTDGLGLMDEEGQALQDQVLIFKHRGKMHAIDHKCPHSSFPLSRGIPFDIEDFGVVLSAGITCPKHSWSFDLFTGNADRGGYKLPIWKVELRDVKASEPGSDELHDKEVWIVENGRIRSRRSARFSTSDEAAVPATYRSGGASDDGEYMDAHSLLMQKYREVPVWWYMGTLVVATALGFAGVGAWSTYTTWGVVPHSVLLALVFVVPVGIVKSITGIEVLLNVSAEFIGGMTIPGNALAMNYFKTYGPLLEASSTCDLFWPDDRHADINIFLLGVPSFQIDIPRVCAAEAPMRFTCPALNSYFTSSVLWGTIGPVKMFSRKGQYAPLLLGPPLGALTPLIFWDLMKLMPRSRWVCQVHPVASWYGGVFWVPYSFSYAWPAVPVAWLSWIYIKSRFLAFWSKYNFVLSASFSAAIAISGIVILFSVQ